MVTWILGAELHEHPILCINSVSHSVSCWVPLKMHCFEIQDLGNLGLWKFGIFQIQAVVIVRF